MNSSSDITRFFTIFGIVFIILGLVFLAIGKLPGFGKLPGDIVIEKKNVTFYFPLATSIIVSLVLSIILMLISRGKQ